MINYFFRQKKVLIRVLALSLFTVIISYILLPYFLVRIKTLPFTFEDFGSLGLRVKLTEEAVSIVQKNPLFGVGLNRSLEYYALNPKTDIFSGREPDAFFKIHNTFLEIAAETGIPGLLFFMGFILMIDEHAVRHGFSKKTNIIGFSAMLGLSGLLIISYVNPFFHTSQMRILILLSVMITV